MSLLNSIRVFIGKTLVFVAATNFLLLPLAEAQSKIKADEAVIKATLQDLGLNKGGKRPTINQVYEKLKDKMPEKIRASISAAVRYHGGSAFPDIQSTVVKDKFGQENIRLIFKGEASQSVVVDYIGQKDRFVRINNTDYSEAEIANITPAIEKAQKRDEVFAKEGQQLAQKLLSTKLTAPSKERVKRMTLTEYVDLMWNLHNGISLSYDAIEYQGNHPKKKSKSSWINIELFESANADNSKKTKGKPKHASLASGSSDPVEVATGGQNTVTVNDQVIDPSEQCVYNGYIGKKDKSGRQCNWLNGPMQVGNEQLGKFVTVKVNFTSCDAKKQKPCNPLLFGAQANAEPFCVENDTTSKNYATTDVGVCRAKSNNYFFGEKSKFNRDGADVDIQKKIAFFASINEKFATGLKKDPKTGLYQVKGNSVLVDSKEAKDILAELTDKYNQVIQLGISAASNACDPKSKIPEVVRQCNIKDTLGQLTMNLAAAVDDPPKPNPDPVTVVPMCASVSDKDADKPCKCETQDNKEVAKKDCKTGQPVIYGQCKPDGSNMPCKCNGIVVVELQVLEKCRQNPLPPCAGNLTSNCDPDFCAEHPDHKSCNIPPNPNPVVREEGLCSTPSGKATCKAVGAVALLGLFTWAMFRNTGKANAGTGVYIPPYCPPNGICTTPAPASSPTPALPTPPPVKAPEAGGMIPVTPAGLTPKVNK